MLLIPNIARGIQRDSAEKTLVVIHITYLLAQSMTESDMFFVSNCVNGIPMRNAGYYLYDYSSCS